MTGNHNLVFGHVFCTFLGHQLQQGALCCPLLATASTNLQSQTCCPLFAFPPLEESCVGWPFSWEAGRGMDVGYVAALLLDAGFLLTRYLCCGLVRARARNCALLSITAGDGVLGATSWGWYPLVLMQATPVALTLLFHLVLSHVHMDTFIFILYSYQS